MNKKYETWSKARRFGAAVVKVLDDGWTQTEAAEIYGVSRQHLNKKVKDAKNERSERVESIKQKAVKAGPLDKQERRVGTFTEFCDTYFQNWICPDCGVHHETPGFHEDMAEAITGDYRRVVINCPPYHSKSTLVTVWHTVYDICRNPNLRTLLVSKSLPFARTFMHSITEMLTNPELYGDGPNLIDDWGPFKPEGQATWSSEQIYVSNRTGAEKDPTVAVLGVGQQIYGRRADVIKFDDVATLDNMRNPDRVAGMLEWFDKEALSRIGRSGKAIWIGTRVQPGDIYSTLAMRQNYKVLKYPCIHDETTERTLWPEHFPYEQALIHKTEMRPADFQLIYQQVDIPGAGASFTEEMIDASKDTSRVAGHYDTGWRLIAGLDPAGGNKGSGFTAFTLLGVDLSTQKRYLIDSVAVKSMKAPQMKQQILEWTDRYPIYEWRVESNGVQSQIIQYDVELVQELAKRGVRVVPHQTHGNKWDPQFGVESMAPLMETGLFSMPWGNQPTTTTFQPMIDELIAFPMGTVSDRVMSLWFADLGVRDLVKRAHLPMFHERMHVPNRIKRKRRVVDFHNREVRGIRLQDQRPGHMSRAASGYRRQTVGNAMDHSAVEEYEIDDGPQPMNIDPQIWSEE
jgi:hypothetical protein